MVRKHKEASVQVLATTIFGSIFGGKIDLGSADSGSVQWYWHSFWS